MRRRLFLVAFTSLVACTSARSESAPGASAPARTAPRPTVRVAAASDLTSAFEELGPKFTEATGHPVTFTFGSSGLLARQLAEGAPFDMFASASPDYADRAAASGRCDAATKAEYAQGRLALFVPANSRAVPATTLTSLVHTSFTRIAIANPDHAPYGVAAKEALTHAGIYDALASRLVYGENVRATLQLAESGNVEAALVAWPNVKGRNDGEVQLLDAAMHAPLRQTGIACSAGRSPEGGRAFLAFLRGDVAQATLARYGFDRAGAR